MKLAGNVVKPAAMNQFGEVMIKDSQQKGQYDIGWILPVSRMQDELGIAVRWKGDGTAVLIYPTGDEVKLIRDQGLAFIGWQHVWPIRKLLAESHHKGRQQWEGSVRMTLTENSAGAADTNQIRCGTSRHTASLSNRTPIQR